MAIRNNIMPILNYTTSISHEKTISEIMKCLSKGGASKIIMDNNSNGDPIALTFQIYFRNNMLAFSLPVRTESVLEIMKRDKKIPRSKCTHDQALRVSWRILKDWIEAQMAICQSGMTEVAEVFLPYAVTKSGLTLFEDLKNGDQKLLNI